MKYKFFKTNQFKRSYKKLKLTDREEEAFIDVAYKLLNVCRFSRVPYKAGFTFGLYHRK